MTLPANEEVILENIRGNAMEIVAEIDPGESPVVEMHVLRSPGREEYTSIDIQPERGYGSGREYWRSAGAPRPRSPRPALVSLHTTHSSALPGAYSRIPEIAEVSLEKDENVKLRIFIDKSVVEVFVNGRQCVAARVYPGRDDSVGVSLRSRGSDSRLISLDAWQMKGIYE
jgi:beta-fructofuranosidase